jgi:hypothetical protein
MSKLLRYLSFLLRLWKIKQNGKDIWRASLEDPHTGEQRGFASMGLMFAFLMEQILRSAGNEQNNRLSEPTDESA